MQKLIFNVLSAVLASTIFLLPGQTMGQVEWTPDETSINTELWIPFIASYNALDTDGFMAVHSENVIRVLRNSSQILGNEMYTRRMQEGNARNKESGRTRNLALSFHERIISDQHCFETGIYRAIVRNADGSEAPYYGEFHTIASREAGSWKLLVDADTSLEAEEGEKRFEEGRILKVE